MMCLVDGVGRFMEDGFFVRASVTSYNSHVQLSNANAKKIGPTFLTIKTWSNASRRSEINPLLLNTSKNVLKIRRIQCLREIRTNTGSFQSIGPKKLNSDPVRFCPKYGHRSNERSGLWIRCTFKLFNVLWKMFILQNGDRNTRIFGDKYVCVCIRLLETLRI